MNRKRIIPLLILLVVMISGCGAQKAMNDSSSPSPSEAAASNQAGNNDTIVYQSERGPVEVPAHPKRIVALTSASNVLSLGIPLVGVDEWTYGNSLFADKLQGVNVVSDENVESILDLEPDLILAAAHNKNIDKFEKIAPTVVYTWGKNDYLKQHLEVGKLLNKEKEAQAWIDDFTERSQELSRKIKAKIGENGTVSVLEGDNKSFYVFGNNFARGTELLYQMMQLNMPDKVKKDALGPGLFAVSNEVLGDYAGDYIVLSKNAKVDNSFMESPIWKNLPAVANHHVIEIDTESSSYSDPITLENLFSIFEKGFLQ
ncbi:iron-hydroxamate ABC transporter substrate-binding protein [Paenibacillus sp. NPDC057934]|uniref:iron-hydroxamate ABC transporter substrate-binding protein n=1 Tax=Paenibacillus sp. NPDC057934 TaxID=3346282 RepID=UPI0036DA9E93